MKILRRNSLHSHPIQQNSYHSHYLHEIITFKNYQI